MYVNLLWYNKLESFNLAGSSPRAVHEPAYQATHDGGDGFSDLAHTVCSLGKRVCFKIYSCSVGQQWQHVRLTNPLGDRPLLKKAKLL